MKIAATVEWFFCALFAGMLALQLLADTEVHQRASRLHRDLTGSSTVQGVTKTTSSADAPVEPSTPFGLKLNADRVKEGWKSSLILLRQGGTPFGLGPGAALPLSMAPELGLTTGELEVFNAHVVAAVTKMQNHERTLAEVEETAEGTFYRIPAYPSEHDSLLSDLRRSVTGALGKKSRMALDLIAASPYLSVGELPATVSAVIDSEGAGVEMSSGGLRIQGPYESDAGHFVTSRYSHLINFAAIERNKKK